MKADTECFHRVTFQGLCVFRTFIYLFIFFAGGGGTSPILYLKGAIERRER